MPDDIEVMDLTACDHLRNSLTIQDLHLIGKVLGMIADGLVDAEVTPLTDTETAHVGDLYEQFDSTMTVTFGTDTWDELEVM